MGRKVVVELKCDRCRKVEHVEEKPNTEATAKGPIFSCTFLGKTTTYEDLCTGCKEVVATHVADIIRDMKKVTPRRTNAGRAAALAKVTSALGNAPSTPVPVSHKPAPGLGERKADSPGSSQRS